MPSGRIPLPLSILVVWMLSVPAVAVSSVDTAQEVQSVKPSVVHHFTTSPETAPPAPAGAGTRVSFVVLAPLGCQSDTNPYGMVCDG